MANPIEDLPGELWKPVVGYEGLYEVSNMGRVATLRRGRVLMTQSYAGSTVRYHCVTLRRNNKARAHYTHHLVLHAFVGAQPEGTWCAHNDGNSLNNHVGNLRWDTPQNNHADKRRHGTLVDGARCYNARLTPPLVMQMRVEHSTGMSVADIARKHGVHAMTAWDAITSRTWKSVVC